MTLNYVEHGKNSKLLLLTHCGPVVLVIIKLISNWYKN